MKGAATSKNLMLRKFGFSRFNPGDARNPSRALLVILILVTAAALLCSTLLRTLWNDRRVPIDVGQCAAKIESGGTRNNYLVGKLPWAKGVKPIEKSYAAQETSSVDPPPMIIWLQGGPGSSSMIGLFYEMGPLKLTGELLVDRNPFTWNRNYSMLFIDNPVGTGFSYVLPLDVKAEEEGKGPSSTQKGTPEREPKPRYSKGYTENQAAVSRDLMIFLEHFYTVFPEHRPADLYITGESYAGKYVPHIAQAILEHNDVSSSSSGSIINLKGVAIGNGLTDPASQVVLHTPQALALGLVSKKQAKAMDVESKRAADLALAGDWYGSSEARVKLFDIFSEASGGINVYDVRKGDVQNSWKGMETFLSIGKIKCALNVPQWVGFSKDPAVYRHLEEDVMKSAKWVVEDLLKRRLPILLYQGQFDFRDGILASNDWIETLEWKGKHGFLDANRTIWKLDGHVAGYVTEFDALRRVEVLLAGHLAPGDAGPSTLDMPPPSTPPKARPRASADLDTIPGRPRRVAELSSDAQIDMIPSKHSFKMWCTSASKLIDQGYDSMNKGDLENAYIYLIRSVRTQKASKIVSDLEGLKKRIEKRHEDWAKLQKESRSDTASPKPSDKQPSSPRPGNITAPNGGTVSSNRFGGSQNRVSPSLPAKDPSPAFPRPLNGQTSVSSNPSVSRTPSFVNSDTILKPTPVVQTVIPVAKPQFLEEKKVAMDDLRSEPPVKPPLVKAPSSLDATLTRRMEDKTMTAAELYAGLSEVMSNGWKTSVLLLDVRAKEIYIEGHIKWRNSLTSGSLSGLVNLEPDWISMGVGSDDIERYLKGFSSYTDLSVAAFEKRSDFDLIVLYDQASSSLNESPTLTAVVEALHLKASSRPLKLQPILLSGGFTAWMSFIRGNGLKFNDWVEIGDGTQPVIAFESIQPSFKPQTSLAAPYHSSPAMNAPSAPSQSASSSVSNFQSKHAYPTAPNPLPSSSISSYQQNSSYIAPSQPLSLTSFTTYEPSTFSSYQFDNPFINFSQYELEAGKNQAKLSSGGTFNNSYGVSSGPLPSYPSLSQSTFTNNRSASNLLMGQSAGYPALQTLTSQMSDMSISTPPIPVKALNAQSTLPDNSYQSQMPGTSALNPRLVTPLNTFPAIDKLPNTPPSMPPKPSTLAQLSKGDGLPPNIGVRNVSLPSPHGSPKPGPKVEIARKPPPPLPPKPRTSIVGMGYSSPVEANDLMSRSDLGSVTMGLVGLRNLGNTCFMNSTLQCLSSTTPFSRYFLGGFYRKHINMLNPLGSKGAVTDKYSQLIKSMWDGQETVVIPSEFKKRIGEHNSQFRGTEQHDSQEFLAYLLDAIHEDMNVAYKPGAKKPVEEYDDDKIPDEVCGVAVAAIFKIWLSNPLIRSYGPNLTLYKTSTTYNPFMYLSVPIPSKNSAGVQGGPVYLYDCLAKFAEAEVLDGDDAWHCPRCKTRRRTKKTLTVSRLPTVLIVHLKRFYFQGPFKDKIETYVDFPIKGLDLTSVSTAKAPDGSLYDLYAISNHMGTLTQGHYTAHIHNGHKGQWYLFDDSRITSCDENALKVSFDQMQ
ncbi:ubiquitin-specific protease doa4 [Dinochytrium kinnereticum]|nr:ubiquitin-specific protease doa4 [Dinochytrium kinnereticum]